MRRAGIAESTTLLGAKIALLCGGTLVTYLRDDFAHIPDPGRWDLPGGVRAPGETAPACALRETQEAFGIAVPPGAVTHAATYTAHGPARQVAFFAARIPPGRVAAIVFGDEGQCWRMMPVAEVLARPDAVPEVQAVLRAALAQGLDAAPEARAEAGAEAEAGAGATADGYPKPDPGRR